ncbi:hypothetical protein KC19_5G156300 [Ceratodon purpureus]|uniref:Uncharacterized protein n=1 Tax=Ceratodon purpureus TaxID=3225 RepID=A0A8T0I3S2_CERPU|nr:hypothetical protein KC19_5G156300 [Ceratodon purpureus]
MAFSKEQVPSALRAQRNSTSTQSDAEVRPTQLHSQISLNFATRSLQKQFPWPTPHCNITRPSRFHRTCTSSAFSCSKNSTLHHSTHGREKGPLLQPPQLPTPKPTKPPNTHVTQNVNSSQQQLTSEPCKLNPNNLLTHRH